MRPELEKALKTLVDVTDYEGRRSLLCGIALAELVSVTDQQPRPSDLQTAYNVASIILGPPPSSCPPYLAATTAGSYRRLFDAVAPDCLRVVRKVIAGIELDGLCLTAAFCEANAELLDLAGAVDFENIDDELDDEDETNLTTHPDP